MSRISDKIAEVKEQLNELEGIVPGKVEDYKSNKLVKAACERYFEKIVEGITDISFMVIAQKKFEIPEEDIASFRILADHKIIKEQLSQKLIHAKGMRNILAHQYGQVDDKLVFESITKELNTDINDFIAEVKKCL